MIPKVSFSIEPLRSRARPRLQPRRVPHLLGHRCDLHVIAAANLLPSILSEPLLSAAFIGAPIHHPTIDYSATLSSAPSVHLLSPSPPVHALKRRPKCAAVRSGIRPRGVASNASGGGEDFEDLDGKGSCCLVVG